MRANLGRLALIALTVGAVSAVSMADTVNPKYTFRLGTFAPGDTDTRNATTNYWFAFGVDRKTTLFKGLGDAGSFTSLSADYYERGGNRAVPVTLNLNFPTANFTYFLGAGLTFSKIAAGNRTVTSIAGTIGATYDLTTRFNVTAKYFVSGNPRLRGFGFYAGMKF